MIMKSDTPVLWQYVRAASYILFLGVHRMPLHPSKWSGINHNKLPENGRNPVRECCLYLTFFLATVIDFVFMTHAEAIAFTT